MKTNYYDFPETKRWLESGLSYNDNPYDIGGRATDISEIGNSLEMRISSIFSVNAIPSEIMAKMNELKVCLKESEQKIQEFILFVCNRTNP